MKFWVPALAAVVLVSGSMHADAAAWPLGQWQTGANGHLYSVQQITGTTNGWLIARSQAQALVAPNGQTVDLATLTSPAEAAFVFAGIDSPTYWNLDPAGGDEGPNIGGFQFDKLAEATGDWAWVTGEPFVYTQWSPGEPNNFGGTEDFLTFYGLGANVRTGNWNDIGSATSPAGTAGSIGFYVAETVPEPMSTSVVGIAAAIGLTRRRRPAF
jgi:hypothetical protein